MAFVCDICGRGPMAGNNVSHAKNRTRMRQKPNLRTVHLVHSGTSTITVRVCADDLKDLKRRGLVQRWKDLPENQPKPAEQAAEAPVDTKPKKLTPKEKKAQAAKKEAAVETK